VQLLRFGNLITECVKYLLGEGADFILTHTFNQDPLEQHFGHYRHGTGDKPCCDVLIIFFVTVSGEKMSDGYVYHFYLFMSSRIQYFELVFYHAIVIQISHFLLVFSLFISVFFSLYS
jgi:hypothetical protein